MLDRGLQPLDAETWLTSLIRLRQEMDRPEHCVENALRLSFLLSRLAPEPFSTLFNANLTETHFEQLVGSDMPEAAAIALLGDGISFELVRDHSGTTVCARIWIDDVHHEVHKGGAHSAAALNQAWIDFLILWICRDCNQSGIDNHRPA